MLTQQLAQPVAARDTQRIRRDPFPSRDHGGDPAGPGDTKECL